MTMVPDFRLVLEGEPHHLIAESRLAELRGIRDLLHAAANAMRTDDPDHWFATWSADRDRLATLIAGIADELDAALPSA